MIRMLIIGQFVCFVAYISFNKNLITFFNFNTQPILINDFTKAADYFISWGPVGLLYW